MFSNDNDEFLNEEFLKGTDDELSGVDLFDDAPFWFEQDSWENLRNNAQHELEQHMSDPEIAEFDLDKIKSLQSNGASLKTYTINGFNALKAAIVHPLANKDPAKVIQFIEYLSNQNRFYLKSANTDLANIDATTILRHIVDTDNIAALKYLLKNKINIFGLQNYQCATSTRNINLIGYIILKNKHSLLEYVFNLDNIRAIQQDLSCQTPSTLDNNLAYTPVSFIASCLIHDKVDFSDQIIALVLSNIKDLGFSLRLLNKLDTDKVYNGCNDIEFTLDYCPEMYSMKDKQATIKQWLESFRARRDLEAYFIRSKPFS